MIRRLRVLELVAGKWVAVRRPSFLELGRPRIVTRDVNEINTGFKYLLGQFALGLDRVAKALVRESTVVK